MTPTRYEARTPYGVPIPRAFKDRAHAIEWADENKTVFPGVRVVAIHASGARTIWRAPVAKPERVAA